MGEKALFCCKDVEQLAKLISISVLQANPIHQLSLLYDPKVESLNVLEDAEHQEVTRNRKYVNGNQYTTLKYKSSNSSIRVYLSVKQFSFTGLKKSYYCYLKTLLLSPYFHIIFANSYLDSELI